MIVLNGIAQWMTVEAFATFKQSFGSWVRAQGYRRILVKRHPIYDSGGIEAILPPHEIVSDVRNLEQMAVDITASTIVGYCTTGLMTLKLLRPDLKCIDWGSDFYCRHAYHGDYSIVPVLQLSGVEIARLGSENCDVGATKTH